jgi:hypothetical protein
MINILAHVPEKQVLSLAKFALIVPSLKTTMVQMNTTMVANATLLTTGVGIKDLMRDPVSVALNSK